MQEGTQSVIHFHVLNLKVDHVATSLTTADSLVPEVRGRGPSKSRLLLQALFIFKEINALCKNKVMYLFSIERDRARAGDGQQESKRVKERDRPSAGSIPK